MKHVPFFVTLALELLLLGLYIRAEYFLWGWSRLSTEEIFESKDAVYAIDQLTWQSGFFLGCMFGMCLMILALKFARRIGVADPAWTWPLMVIPIIPFVWIFIIK